MATRIARVLAYLAKVALALTGNRFRFYLVPEAQPPAGGTELGAITLTGVGDAVLSLWIQSGPAGQGATTHFKGYWNVEWLPPEP